MGTLVYPCIISLGEDFLFKFKGSHVEEACRRNPDILESGLKCDVCILGKFCLFAIVDLTQCNILHKNIGAFMDDLLFYEFSFFILVDENNKKLIHELRIKQLGCFIRNKSQAQQIFLPIYRNEGLIDLLHGYEMQINGQEENNANIDIKRFRRIIGQLFMGRRPIG
jgi:hypothetical protein